MARSNERTPAPRRLPVTAAFTLSWDGRMIRQGSEPARGDTFHGTPEEFRTLAAEGLVDKLRVVWRPCVLGGKSDAPITGLDEKFLPHGIVLELIKLERRADECVATYRVQPGRP